MGLCLLIYKLVTIAASFRTVLRITKKRLSVLLMCLHAFCLCPSSPTSHSQISSDNLCLPYHLSLSLQIALYLSFLWGPPDGNMNDGRALNGFPYPVLPTSLEKQVPTLTPNRNHPFWPEHVSPEAMGTNEESVSFATYCPLSDS